MTSTAVTPISRAPLSIDIKKINYKAAAAQAAKYTKAVGGSEREARANLFPGVQFSFSLGQWTTGTKKAEKKAVPQGTRLVANMPNIAATWLKWEYLTDKTTGEMVEKDGKPIKYPNYLPLCFPAMGDDMKLREELGDTDQSEWETDDKGNPQDPWKPVLAIPVRLEDDTTINHILLSTKSSTIAGFNLFAEVMEEMVTKSGQLPVIEIGSAKAESKRKVKKIVRGKEVLVDVTNVWDVPTFEVVEWIDAAPCDNPGPEGIPAAETTDDIGKVETTTRTAAVAAPKTAAKVPAKKAAETVPVTKTKAAKPEPKMRRKVNVDDEI